jgi:predicted phage tail protein
MRTLYVYGVLAAKLPAAHFDLAIETAAEAVRFLIANFPEIERVILSCDWRVIVGDLHLDRDDLHLPVGIAESVHLVPVVKGSGAGARIVAGAVLIAASFFIPGVALAGVALGPVAFGVGASLVIGGVTQLLAPKVSTPRRERNPQEVRSYSISGVQNTSREGTAVNVAFGEIVIGGIVISAGTTTADLPASKTSRSRSYGSPRTGAGGTGGK